MLAETIAMFCFFGLIGFFLLKCYNIMTGTKLYGTVGVVLSFVVLFLLQALFYVSFFSTIGDKTTIVSASGTTTVTNSDYRALAQYAHLANILFFIDFFLVVIESFFLFPRLIFVYMPRQKGAKK
jgi:hypothetical protein